MSKQSLNLLTLNVIATAAVLANRFVGLTGAPAAALANAYGVSEMSAAIGERFAVTNQGTAVVETGAAIAAGALVESDATGRAITRATGVVLGRLLPSQAATAAGQFVEVILFNN